MQMLRFFFISTVVVSVVYVAIQYFVYEDSKLWTICVSFSSQKNTSANVTLF